METVNLVVMGKTGAGKSTLINAVLGEELAPTGSGSAVTKEVHTYSKKMLVSKKDEISGGYRMIYRKLNLYDTVGLEIDSAITKKTLEDIREILNKTKVAGNDQDITLVWFCMSAASSRFEKYEAELIKDLSIEYEIPFVIVLTQCFSDERGELELQIAKDLPEISAVRVLAKDYRIREGVISAFGVDNLLNCSILEYSEKRVHILQAKLDWLVNSQRSHANILTGKGQRIVEEYAEKASKIGVIPFASIPFVHGLCAKMIHDLNRLYGVNAPAENHIANAMLGIIATPLMIVPVLSSAVASGYVAGTGETYLEALSLATNDGTLNVDISRVYEELKRQKKKMEERT